VKIFEEGEMYYALPLDRVGAMVMKGKSLDDIKTEVKIRSRHATNTEAIGGQAAGLPEELESFRYRR
jgi:hypothetical protein